jgi:hypothetical protein
VGKKRLAVETAQFLSQREIFKDGIFYIDLKGVTTTDEFKSRTSDIIKECANIEKESDLDSRLEVNNMLLLMDNVDEILNQKGKFDWSITSLIDVYQNIKVIIISHQEINRPV